MRETETYRPILEQIILKYGKHTLSVSEVMEFTGRGRKWCREHLGVTGTTTAENIAMKLAKL